MAISKKALFWIAGAVLLGGLAVGGYLWASGAPEVQTIRVQKREVVELYVATGQLEARRTSDVSVELAGIVREVPVEAGDRVERGDVLVELRPRDAELAVQQAEAQVETLKNDYLDLKRGPTKSQTDAARADVEGAEAQLKEAERELKRARELRREGLATGQAVDKAQAAVDQAEARLANARARLETLREQPRAGRLKAAEARLEQAKVDLERARDDVAETSVRAPFGGLVLSVDADAGERVAPGTTVARLADMSTAEVFAEVDEDYFGRIEEGQTATLIFPSMPGQSFPATVRQVGPEMDPERGVVGIHLEPETLPDNAIPGLTVDVNIEVARLDDAAAVPAEAVVSDREGAYVLVVEQGRAVRRSVEIRARGERWTAVDGLESGQQVVRAAARLEPGTAVEALEADADDAQAGRAGGGRVSGGAP